MYGVLFYWPQIRAWLIRVMEEKIEEIEEGRRQKRLRRMLC